MEKDMEDAAKSRQLKEYYARHGRIFVVVDATRPDVIVPDHLRQDLALTLVLNVRMPQPICFHRDYLESDFSFGGRSMACHIPMSAIWAAYLPDRPLDSGILWEQDIPAGMQAAFMAAGEQLKQAGEPSTAKPSDRKKQEQADDGNSVRPQHGRAHLRVVK